MTPLGWTGELRRKLCQATEIAQWEISTKDKIIVQCRRPSRQGQTLNTETAIASGKGKEYYYCHLPNKEHTATGK